MKGLFQKIKAWDKPTKRIAFLSFISASWLYLRDYELSPIGGSLLLDIFAYLIIVILFTPVVFFVLAMVIDIVEYILEWIKKE
jgi:hypothetical protein